MDTSTLSYTDLDANDIDIPKTTTKLDRVKPQPVQGIKIEWISSSFDDLSLSPSSTPSSPIQRIEIANMQNPWNQNPEIPMPNPKQPSSGSGGGDDSAEYSSLLLILIPVMVVVLTVLLGMVVFLVAVLYMRRRRGIRLTEDGGPLDLSKGDGVIGEGGVDGVESRWLETLDPEVRDAYKRAKDWQLQYPPSSVPTDITLTQFLSIQEKGVSAWAFEPDYEDNLSLYVQSRTEITFLADGPGMAAREGGGNSVMANLPLPKLNEVYYWEVKLYEKSATTEIAIGLATKPYPSFRLPGWNKYSVAYFASDGFKSHNYPFTASSYGPPLAEGDVLGVGYRPRTGTVFFTRNGRKLEDAYTGLQRLNLFPTVGANGPCTLHVNLGQAGFVFIEANVKKWGLAPMVGTLAPPPAYGSERGSILLDAGYGTPGANQGVGATHLNSVNALLEAARARSGASLGTSAGSSSSSLQQDGPRTPISRSLNSSRRHRRAGKAANLAGSVPNVPSPLRSTEAGPSGTRRRVLGRAGEDVISPDEGETDGRRVAEEENTLEYVTSEDESDSSHRERRSETGSGSPIEHNPPTPNLLDISLHSLRNTAGNYFSAMRSSRSPVDGDDDEDEVEDMDGSGESDETARPRPKKLILGQRQSSPPPPGYAPLDPHVYANGLPADLPEEMVNQAIAAMSEAEQVGNGSRQPTLDELAQAQILPRPRNQQSGNGPFGWLSFGGGAGSASASASGSRTS